MFNLGLTLNKRLKSVSVPTLNHSSKYALKYVQIAAKASVRRKAKHMPKELAFECMQSCGSYSEILLKGNVGTSNKFAEGSRENIGWKVT